MKTCWEYSVHLWIVKLTTAEEDKLKNAEPRPPTKFVLPSNIPEGTPVVFILYYQQRLGGRDRVAGVYSDIMQAIAVARRSLSVYYWIQIFVPNSEKGSDVVWTTDCIDTPEECPGFNKYWPDGFPT
jgi:hypothetical protein